jgi:F-type H+-transporting ATPase subunit epsilon
MAQSKMNLTIVSQERQLVSTLVDSVSAPTTEGEITVLPDHLPILTQLQVGELVYRVGKEEYSFVVSRGFMDVGPDKTITVMVDAATDAREISVKKAEEAIQRAHDTMQQTTDQRELMLAEASLKQAMWEIRVAQKTRRTQI